MKWFLLIWAALLRKPARTALTFLSVVAAFTLFGLAIGLNASYARILAVARQDRIYVLPRFDNSLTLAQRDQLMHLSDVIQIGTAAFLPSIGYYRVPKNTVVATMVDGGMRRIWADVLTPAQWDELETSPAGVIIDHRTAARLGVKKGDAFPVLTKLPTRRDGSNLWPFRVLDVVADYPLFRAGLIVGNYNYLETARTSQLGGTVYQIELLIKNPNRADQVAHAIDSMYANSSHPTWSIPENTLTESNTSYQFDIPFVTNTVAMAGLFMILFLVANNIAQSVRERVAEFALLKALGSSDVGVMMLVFAEAAIPCLVGAVIGLILAVIISIRLPSLALPPSMGVALPYFSPEVIALAIFCSLSVAFVGAAQPALRMMRLNIAEALRQ